MSDVPSKGKIPGFVWLIIIVWGGLAWWGAASDKKTTSGTPPSPASKATLSDSWRDDLSYFCQAMESSDTLTKDCALQHLQKSNCTALLQRDFLDVQEVKEETVPAVPARMDGTLYVPGTPESRQATAIYSFKKRPVDGPVSDWPQRDQIAFLKDKGHWTTWCE